MSIQNNVIDLKSKRSFTLEKEYEAMILDWLSYLT